MIRRALLLLMLLLLAAACEPSRAPTKASFRALTSFRSSPDGRALHVSPEGSSTAAGTWQQTLDVGGAMRRAVPGDTAIFASGIYPPFTWTTSGTAEKPITITAQTPAFQWGPAGERRKAANIDHSTIDGEMTIRASNLIVEGFWFGRTAGSGLEVHGAQSQIVIRNNHFFENRNTGLLITASGSTDNQKIEAHDNFFESHDKEPERDSFPGSTARMDYGIRIHNCKNCVFEYNLFWGYFHHAISNKERTDNVIIAYNVFDFCNRWCIEGGQNVDSLGGDARDRTAQLIKVYRNVFDTEPGESGERMLWNAVNAKSMEVWENQFRQGGRMTIKHRLGRGRKIFKHVGPDHPENVRIEGNSFEGSGYRLDIYGRGRSGERVTITGNTGPVDCTVREFDPDKEMTDFSTISNEGHPDVSVTSNSFACTDH